MARGINKVILVGNLGREPEIRQTNNNSVVSNITLATSSGWKDKQTGEMQDRTEWHRVVFFGRLAEIARDYLHKGAKVYIEGSLRTRKWQDSNGVERYTTEIVGNEMVMLDNKGTSSHQNRMDAPLTPAYNANHPDPKPTGENTPSHPTTTITDDDIPF